MVKGGQGRTPSSIVDDAANVVWLGVIIAATGLAALVWRWL